MNSLFSKETKELFIKSIFPVLSGIIVVVGAVYAWTEPSVAPPEGNVPAPLNVGPSGQIKSGGLAIGSGLTASDVGLSVLNGLVGIGTINPTQKLDVIGYARGSTGLCIGDDCRTSWPSGGNGGTCNLILAKNEKSGTTETELTDTVTLTEPGMLVMTGYVQTAYQGVALVSILSDAIIEVDGVVCSQDRANEGQAVEARFYAETTCVKSLGAGSHTLKVIHNTVLMGREKIKMQYFVLKENGCSPGIGNLTDYSVYQDSTDQTINMGPHAFCALSRVYHVHASQACICMINRLGNLDWTLEVQIDEAASGGCGCGAICIN